MRVIKGIMAVLIAGILPVACSEERAGEESSREVAAPQVVETQVEDQALRVTLSLTPGQPRLSDQLRMEMRIESEEWADVLIPPFGETLGGMKIRSIEEQLPEREGVRRVVKQVFQLEPTRVGEHRVLPVRFTYRDVREGNDAEEHVLRTESLSIQVISPLAGEDVALANLKAGADARLIDVAAIWPWLLFGAFLTGGVITYLVIRIRNRRLAMRAAIPPSPRELARRELQLLVEDNPLARDEMQTFFVMLTGVVRRFIERTTGVRAPEQTTEEFLNEMRSHAGFGGESRDRLRSFLESADLVKFAAFRPERNEIDDSFLRAQKFVGLPGDIHLRNGKEVAV